MPGLSIQQTDEATEDLRLQSIWYDVNAGADIAERYLNAFVEATQQIAVQADLGRTCHFRHSKLDGLRSHPVSGAFKKHLIFYRLENDVIVIFRVLHGMRDLPRRLLEPPGADD